jgi:hypothetical protein
MEFGGKIMDNNNPIIENIAKPHELEVMFRREPESFKKTFSSAWEQHPDSQVLAVWNERLNFREAAASEKAGFVRKDFFAMGILAVLAGLSTRIILQFVEQQALNPVNLVFGIIPFIAALFIYGNRAKRKVVFIIAALFLISAVYINVLPMSGKDSVVLAYLHLPVFLWVLLGAAFTGNEYRLSSSRLSYLKFNGEFLIMYAVMAISGMLLTGLTMQLFGVISMNISEFYFENVVLFGAASLAVVATYLVSRNLKLAKSIAPYIARIFSPLVLITLLVYLATVIWVGKNPFLDRDFLMAFNGVLLSVLAVTIFSVTESGKNEKKTVSDYVNFALIALALIIDSVALSAIMFRLSSYGISPNRLAVLGINMLIWGNLIWIIISYIRFLKNKTGPSAIHDAVTKYLPVYGIWSAFVTFVFPLIF